MHVLEATKSHIINTMSLFTFRIYLLYSYFVPVPVQVLRGTMAKGKKV